MTTSRLTSREDATDELTLIRAREGTIAALAEQAIYAWEQNDEFVKSMLELKKYLRHWYGEQLRDEHVRLVEAMDDGR